MLTDLRNPSSGISIDSATRLKACTTASTPRRPPIPALPSESMIMAPRPVTGETPPVRGSPRCPATTLGTRLSSAKDRPDFRHPPSRSSNGASAPVPPQRPGTRYPSSSRTRRQFNRSLAFNKLADRPALETCTNAHIQAATARFPLRSWNEDSLRNQPHAHFAKGGRQPLTRRHQP